MLVWTIIIILFFVYIKNCTIISYNAVCSLVYFGNVSLENGITW